MLSKGSEKGIKTPAKYMKDKTVAGSKYVKDKTVGGAGAVKDHVVKHKDKYMYGAGGVAAGVAGTTAAGKLGKKKEQEKKASVTILSLLAEKKKLSKQASNATDAAEVAYRQALLADNYDPSVLDAHKVKRPAGLYSLINPFGSIIRGVSGGMANSHIENLKRQLLDEALKKKQLAEQQL